MSRLSVRRALVGAAALSVAASLVVAQPARAATSWYVSPTGAAGNAGTLASPWDLTSALSGHSGSIVAGDTVYLRGGAYSASVSGSNPMYTASMSGTSGSRITIRRYQSEEPVLTDNRAQSNGSTLKVTGSYLTFRDFTITNSNTTRTTPSPANNFRPMGIEVGGDTGSQGTGSKFINLVIHDAGHGIGLWGSALNSELYGTLFYNNGQDNTSTDLRYGHNVYTNGNSNALIKGNLLMQNFGFGVHAYGSGSQKVSNLTFDSNVISEAGALSFGSTDANWPSKRLSNFLLQHDGGGGCPGIFCPSDTSTGNTINNNTVYRPLGIGTTGTFVDNNMCLQCGYTPSGKFVGSKTITNNYSVGGVSPLTWAISSTGTMTGNTLVSTSTGYTTGVQNKVGVGNSFYSVNSNSYYGGNAAPFLHVDTAGTGHTYTFAQWKTNTGWDAAGSATSSLPSMTGVGWMANAYETGRGNFVVLNWSGASTASLPLGGLGLVNGDSFEVRNAADWYHSPVATGTYSSSSPNVSVSMTGLTVAAATGWTDTPSSTAPTFASFIVRKV